MKVAVCSTSNEAAVTTIVRKLLGPERAAKMKIFAGKNYCVVILFSSHFIADTVIYTQQAMLLKRKNRHPTCIYWQRRSSV